MNSYKKKKVIKMADVSEHYVSVENLRKAYSYIYGIMQSNMQNEHKILNLLSEMKSSLKVNGKTLNNKSDLIDKNFGQYRENCKGCANSFATVANRYVSSVEHASRIIKSSLEG